MSGYLAEHAVILGLMVLFLVFCLFRFPELQDVHEVIPAFLVSVVVYLIVSKITARRRPDRRHLDRLFTLPDSS